MKYKKYNYIIVLMLMLIIGINTVFAVEKTNYEKMEINYRETNNKKTNNTLMQIAKTTAEHPDCAIFGDKNNPESIRYLVNEILQYPKIIVPILVIILGILDFGKAVMASKEDEMRKAQSTFIKRVLISIVIFFVPMILDIIMYFMDLALGYTGCGL